MTFSLDKVELMLPKNNIVPISFGDDYFFKTRQCSYFITPLTWDVVLLPMHTLEEIADAMILDA